uniref:Transmembrane protein 248 n=1 Tax=Eptatretus burgeri TaxID=7764 RepID=A0A8C4Q648_EPTBU
MRLSLHYLSLRLPMVNARPPLVMFMVTLSGFAIGFLSLGYFFKMREIKTPEVTQDWNMFLLHFNDLDFCMSENETLRFRGPNETSLSTSPTLNKSGPVNVSVMITLTLDPMKPFGGYSRNVTHLSATVYGYQIGLSGRDAQLEINMTFSLPSLWGSEDCLLRGQCQQIVFYNTCLTITAAQSAFPKNAVRCCTKCETVQHTSTSHIKHSCDGNDSDHVQGSIRKAFGKLKQRACRMLHELSQQLNCWDSSAQLNYPNTLTEKHLYIHINKGRVHLHQKEGS